MQILGNLCLSLAGAIYLLPWQHLLLEYSRKRDDGGGAIAAIIILAPMWMLLMVSLLLTAAQGGFDSLPLRRGLIHGLVVAAVIALAVVTFASFACLNRPTWSVRLTLGLPVYLLPLLTIAFAAVAMNPGLASRIPVGALRLSWLAIAGLSLAGCLVFLGTNLVRRASRVATGIVHTARQEPEIRAKLLAEVPTFDPQVGFSSLIFHATQADSPELRRLATERLRTHPDLVGQLIESLGATDPSPVISFIANADFSDDERARLALPLHRAMEDFGDYIHSRLNYFPQDWKRRMRAWGRPTYRAVAAKFSGAGPEFTSLPQAFDEAFVPE